MTPAGRPEKTPQNSPPEPTEESLLETAQAAALYTASLPERTLRAMVGAASGVLRESARAAVPDAMKRTKFYELTVRKMLGFLVKDVGGLEAAAARGAGGSMPAGSISGVPGATGAAAAVPGIAAENAPAAVPEGSEFVVKKAIGNAIDIAGLATLHLSPLWVIAAFSDVVLGARTYLNALGEELRARGVISPEEKFEGVDGLLKSLQKLSGAVADNLDTPPVTVKELEKMVSSLREESKRVDLTRVLPEAELKRLWDEIHTAAKLEGRSPFEVSSAMGMMVFTQISRIGQGAYGTVKVGFDLVHDNILKYYVDSLGELRRKGFYQSIIDVSHPYMEGLGHLFQPSRESYTEQILKGKPFAALWRKLRAWCRRRRRERGVGP